MGLLPDEPVSGCGDARVAPPCPTTCVCGEIFTLPYLTLVGEGVRRGCVGRVQQCGSRNALRDGPAALKCEKVQCEEL